ncbi:hypothetical protein E7811_04895 [Aliigemmobacter aestuarii]|uniref:NADH:ubiquinone oxidoreductase n=1 Tax=Aliigemmobacter aestuarii TaxID=1445661 RepID=A0A4S3MR94_9RHOB|nr:hypothetical protein [Gemmobacter aestuarii]THD85060.1 hypothetical protein E7811_04895 [Gemmobacter aestuarii]
MFRNWGFLLGEIWVLLLLAALIGLLAGWIIWGRRAAPAPVGHDSGEADRLRTALSECEARGKAQSRRLTALERELDDAGNRLMKAETLAKEATDAAPQARPSPVMPPVADLPDESVTEPGRTMAVETVRPEALAAARGGQPDDLKKIKGIGPKLEQLCHRLGFFHFDQIAAWTVAEIAWVDENLEGFKGRVTRDEWVKQAAILSAGGSTEFARRVQDGEVY